MGGDGGEPTPAASGPGGVGGVELPGLTVLRRLGGGRTSDVYLARQHDLQRVVAVKVIRAGADEDVAWRAFVHEAQVVARLGGHRHVLNVYDAGLTATGRPFLVTEYLDRGSLADVLATEGRLPAAEVGRIGVGVADALAAVHQRGLVHGDVRPGNVLLGSNGAVKLAGFGIAGAEEGPPIDVRDLAATLLAALTGRSATGPEALETPLVPAALGAVLAPALVMPPDDRPSLSSLRQALAAAAEGRDEAPPGAGAGSPTSSSSTRATAGDPTRVLPVTGADRSPTVALPLGPADGAATAALPVPRPARAVPEVSPRHAESTGVVSPPMPTRVPEPPGSAPAAPRPARPRRRRRAPALVAILVVIAGGAIAVAWSGRGDGAAESEATATTPVDPGVTSTEAPPPADPATFLRNYYGTLSAGSYAEAYAMLAPEFESVGSFEDYAAFWGGVDGIEVLDVEPVDGSDDWPRRFNLTMRYTIGDRVTTELDELTVRPDDGGQLLISAYRVVTTL